MSDQTFSRESFGSLSEGKCVSKLQADACLSQPEWRVASPLTQSPTVVEDGRWIIVSPLYPSDRAPQPLPPWAQGPDAPPAPGLPRVIEPGDPGRPWLPPVIEPPKPPHYPLPPWEQKPYPNPYPPKPVEPNADLYDGKSSKESIQPSGVDQGKYGDCFFMASLAALAGTPKGQDIIRDMIKENKDGSYTVTFKGKEDHPITITKDELNKMDLRDSATWARVIEGAFLKYQNDAMLGFWKKDGISLLGNCQTSHDAIALLTGKDVTTDQNSILDVGNQALVLGSTAPEQVKHDMIEAFKRGDIVTAGAGNGIPFVEQDNGSLPGQHVYSVLGYDEKTDTVTIRNPWGDMADYKPNTPGQTVDGITYKGDGVMTMSFDTFRSHFDDVNIAGENKYYAHGEHLLNDVENSGKDFIGTFTHLFQGEFGKSAESAFDFLIKDPLQTGSEILNTGTEFVNDAVKEGVGLVGDVVSGIGDAISSIF